MVVEMVGSAEWVTMAVASGYTGCGPERDGHNDVVRGHCVVGGVRPR